MKEKKKVGIVGGGFCGALCAKKLERSFEVTLFDTKMYFEYIPSVLEIVGNTSAAKRIRVTHTHYLKKSHIVVGQVSHISEREVVVDDKTHSFDYLIICTGARYGTVFSKNVINPSSSDSLGKGVTSVQEASSIVLIGGGIVGVELAGELVEYYPDKKIHLIESGDVLMRRNHEKTQAYALSFLKKKGVDVVFGERVSDFVEGHFITNKGRKIEAEIGFVCTGITPNTDLIEGVTASCLDDRHCVMVNEFLQVKGFNHIFAGGDVTNISEEKTAQASEKHASVICGNIKALEKKKALKAYVPQKRPILISLGAHDCIMEHGDFVMGGRIPAVMKKMVEFKTMMKYR